VQITSFQKALLAVGGGLALVGGGITVGVLRAHRRQDELEAYTATPVKVDDFVRRTFDAFDTGTYGDPLVQVPDEGYYTRRETPDGIINLGVEDSVDSRKTFFREIVDDRDLGYYQRLNGREFLRAADTDENGQVTKQELTAAVRPFAGDDGALDEAERRTVIVEHGLGKIVRTEQLPVIAGWGTAYDGPRTAAAAAKDVMRDIRVIGAKQGDKPDPRGLPIDRIAPSIPWTRYGEALGTGDISSMAPGAAKVDRAGNHDGYLSTDELAKWIADTYQGGKLLYGHVDAPRDKILKDLASQRIGRVDASALRGHLYYDTSISESDRSEFYGGDVRTFLDGIEGFSKARGDAPWEPDPLSGKPSPKPKTETQGG
jgi:hypothetical protein